MEQCSHSTLMKSDRNGILPQCPSLKCYTGVYGRKIEKQVVRTKIPCYPAVRAVTFLKVKKSEARVVKII